MYNMVIYIYIVCVYIYICICICICICIYIYMYMCVYIYIYTPRQGLGFRDDRLRVSGSDCKDGEWFGVGCRGCASLRVGGVETLNPKP